MLANVSKPSIDFIIEELFRNSKFSNKNLDFKIIFYYFKGILQFK